MAVALMAAACTSQNENFGSSSLGDAAPVDPGADAGVEVAVGADVVAGADAAVGAEVAPADLGGDLGAASLAIDKTEANFNGMPGCPGSFASFRVTNTGGSPSGALTVELMGGDFRQVTDSCSGKVLPPAGACEVQVQFHPLLEGTRAGTLAVKADPGGQRQARLSGFALHGDSRTLTPNAVDFDRILVGQASAATTLTLRNVGSQVLHLQTASVSTTEFVIGGDECSGQMLAPGDSCELKVAFRPQSVGVKSAVLTLPASDCGAGVVGASLVGTGLAADTALIIEPGSHDFGKSCLPAGTREVNLRVSNLGKTARGPLATAVEGPFGIGRDGCSGITLDSLGSCVVVATYRPTTPGSFTGKLSVTAPDAAVSATLAGKAAGHGYLSVTVSPPGLGSVAVGQTSAPVEVKITNLEPEPADMLTFTLTNVAASEYTITEHTCGSTLAGGASCRALIVFTPAAPGVRNATLSITGGYCTPMGLLQLTGTGI